MQALEDAQDHPTADIPCNDVQVPLMTGFFEIPHSRLEDQVMSSKWHGNDDGALHSVKLLSELFSGTAFTFRTCLLVPDIPENRVGEFFDDLFFQAKNHADFGSLHLPRKYTTPPASHEYVIREGAVWMTSGIQDRMTLLLNIEMPEFENEFKIALRSVRKCLSLRFIGCIEDFAKFSMADISRTLEFALRSTIIDFSENLIHFVVSFMNGVSFEFYQQTTQSDLYFGGAVLHFRVRIPISALLKQCRYVKSVTLNRVDPKPFRVVDKNKFVDEYADI